MFGRLSAGPASSRARAVPLPMPLPIKPCRIGTSVSVAKYMKAPAKAATKLAMKELPPTARLTQTEGISPSCPGRPSRMPEMRTPNSKSGRICLAKPQLSLNHAPVSSSLGLMTTLRPTIPATKATVGWPAKTKARMTAGVAASTTCHFGRPYQSMRIRPKPAAKMPVISHLLP